jgi:hypothetical protein
MAENTSRYKTEVEIDVDTNIEPSIKQLKELKKQLKETAAGSAEFKRLSANIKDVEDALEEAKVGAKSFADQLEEAPGPIGAIASGFRKLEIATKSFGAAFKAVGIGLIVAAVAGIAAAFSKSEESVKKFEPLMIGLEKILNGVLEAIMPLIDGFIELATQALPYVSKAFSVVYSAITAVFQSLGKLGGAVVKLLKGDFKGAWSDAKESVTGFSKNFDSSMDRFEAGTKKMTKTQKENLKEQGDDLKKAAEEAKKIREEEQKELLDGQKEAFLALLSEREQEEYKVNEHYNKLLYLATKYGDDTTQLKEAQAKALAAIDKKYRDEELEKAKKILDEGNKVVNDAYVASLSARDQEIYKAGVAQNERLLALDKAGITDKSAVLEQGRAEISAINKKYDDEDAAKLLAAQQDASDKRLRLLELNGQTLIQGTRAYYANRLALINELENKELADLKLQYDKKKISKEEFESASTDIQKKYSQQRKDVNNAELNAYLGYATNVLGAINGIFSAASEVNKMQQEQDLKNAKGNAVEEEKIRKKAFEQNKKTQIAQAIIGTLQAAIQAFQSLAVIPVVGPALGAAAAAAALVFGYKKVALIKAQTYESQSSGAGSAAAGGGASIATPSVAGTPTPVIGGTQAATPGSQIAETIGAASGKPIRAFVVSGEVSSQQALDRRTNVAATFGG